MSNALNNSRVTTLSSNLIALLLLVLPFERIPSVDILGGQVTLKLNQVVAVALIIASASIAWRLRPALARPPRLFLIAFLSILVISGLLAYDLSSAIRVTIATSLTCVAALATSFSYVEKDLDTYEKALLMSTWAVLLFGAFQYLGDTFGLSSSLTGLTPNYVKEVFGFPRIQSVALEPLYLASFLLIPFSILSAKELLHSKSRSVTLLMTATVLFLTVSRGGIIGGAFVAVLLVCFSFGLARVGWKRVVRYVGLLTTAAILAYSLTFTSSLFAGNKSNDQKFSSENKTKKIVDQTLNFDSQDDRVRNRQLAWRVFTENPVLGIGPGNFDQYAKADYPPYQASTRVIVNNEPLELLAETGFLGFLTLMTFFAALALSVWRYVVGMLRAKRPTSLGDVFVIGLSAYMFATAIQFQTFSTLYIMHIWVAIGFLMAIAITDKITHDKPAKKTSVK